MNLEIEMGKVKDMIHSFPDLVSQGNIIKYQADASYAARMILTYGHGDSDLGREFTETVNHCNASIKSL